MWGTIVSCRSHCTAAWGAASGVRSAGRSSTAEPSCSHWEHSYVGTGDRPNSEDGVATDPLSTQGLLTVWAPSPALNAAPGCPCTRWRCSTGGVSLLSRKGLRERTLGGGPLKLFQAAIDVAIRAREG